MIKVARQINKLGKANKSNVFLEQEEKNERRTAYVSANIPMKSFVAIIICEVSTNYMQQDQST